VLLEVRAHADASSAQAERMRAQLEGLDARVATLERTCAATAAPRPTAAPRGRMPTLLDMPADVLHRLADLIDPNDEFAAALACRRLRDALRNRRGPRTLTTHVCSLVGSLGRLRWGVACGAPVSDALYIDVADSGDLRMLSWLCAQGRPWVVPMTSSWTAAAAAHECGVELCDSAAAGGHLSALRWLRAVGCPWQASTCASAALYGHLTVLQWARANGSPWDEGACARAAHGGHSHVLQWLCANGCPWDHEVCSCAANAGHLGVLQWLRANGCPWDRDTCARAALGGHLGVLQWLRANGCPWDHEVCSCAAN
jgi:hypothetical protein